MTQTTKTPAVVKATVSSRCQQAQPQARAERDAVRRHQKALREIERWDVARETRPHTPNLARDVLRADEVVMQAIHHQSGPLPSTGPRTASHPAAPTMDEVVAEIVMKPTAPLDFVPPPPLHLMARNAQPYIALLGCALAFFAGMALGRAL